MKFNSEFLNANEKVLNFNSLYNDAYTVVKTRSQEFSYSEELSDTQLKYALVYDHYMYWFAQNMTSLSNDSSFLQLNSSDKRRISAAFIEYFSLSIKKLLNSSSLYLDRILIFSLDSEILLNMGVPVNEVKLLEEIREKYKNGSSDLINNYKSGRTLSINEHNKLCRFFSGKIPCDDKELQKLQYRYFCEVLFSILNVLPVESLTLNGTNDILTTMDQRQLEFLTKYLYFYGLNERFNRNYDMPFLFCASLSSGYAYTAGNGTFAAFSYDMFYHDKKFLWHLLACVHEGRHVFQLSKEFQEDSSYKSIAFEEDLRLLFWKYLKGENGAVDYKVNYDNLETEIDANRNAFFILENLFKDCKKSIKDVDLVKKIDKSISTFMEGKNDCTLREHTTSRKNLTTGLVENTWDFKFKNLDAIISKQPQILNEFPRFKTFYYSNGMPKTLLKVFVHEKDLFANTHNYFSNIFLDFCRYRFSQGDMSFFNIDIYSDNLKNRIYDNIEKMFLCFLNNFYCIDSLLSEKTNLNVINGFLSRIDFDFELMKKMLGTVQVQSNSRIYELFDRYKRYSSDLVKKVYNYEIIKMSSLSEEIYEGINKRKEDYKKQKDSDKRFMLGPYLSSKYDELQKLSLAISNSNSYCQKMGTDLSLDAFDLGYCICESAYALLDGCLYFLDWISKYKGSSQKKMEYTIVRLKEIMDGCTNLLNTYGGKEEGFNLKIVTEANKISDSMLRKIKK